MRYSYDLKTVSVRVSDPLPGAPTIGDPDAVGRFLIDMLEDFDADQEHVIMLALDVRHRVNGFKVLSSGTRTESPVDPMRVFRVALALDAAGIIIAHNHPSGVLEPSGDDIALTARLAKAGELIGIAVHDHIIIGSGSYLSLRRSRPGLFSQV